MVDRRQRSWMDIDREWSLADVLPIIREVPDAKYLILNVANGMTLSEEEAGVIRNANVLIDTSGREISNLGELMQHYGGEKFAFGTHSPILDPVTSLLRIETLRAEEANADLVESLRSGNAKRFLGIEG